MASNKHGAPAPVVSSPEPVNRPLGFLVFSEVRGCKLDTDPEKQAAFDDDKRLEKEVEAYNQSITKARTIRYNVLLEMSRLNLLDRETYVSTCCLNCRDSKHSLKSELEDAGLRAGFHTATLWNRPSFWWSLNSEELWEMFSFTYQSFSTNDITDLERLMRCISSVGIAERHEDWEEWSGKLTELDLNAHLDDEDQKKQALIAPRSDVEIYERMRLFQAVVQIALETQAALLEEAGATGL